MWKVERQSVGLAAVTQTDACPRVYIYIYYIQISLGIALAIPSDTPSDARLPWNRAGRPYYSSYFYTLSDMLWIFKIEAGLGSDAPNVKNIKTVATAGTRPNLCFIIRTCIEFRCVLIWYVHHLHKLFSGCFLLPVLSIRPSSWDVSRATTWNLAHGLTSWCLNWSLVLSSARTRTRSWRKSGKKRSHDYERSTHGSLEMSQNFWKFWRSSCMSIWGK